MIIPSAPLHDRKARPFDGAGYQFSREKRFLMPALPYGSDWTIGFMMDMHIASAAVDFYINMVLTWTGTGYEGSFGFLYDRTANEFRMYIRTDNKDNFDYKAWTLKDVYGVDSPRIATFVITYDLSENKAELFVNGASLGLSTAFAYNALYTSAGYFSVNTAYSYNPSIYSSFILETIATPSQIASMHNTGFKIPAALHQYVRSHLPLNQGYAPDTFGVEALSGVNKVVQTASNPYQYLRWFYADEQIAAYTDGEYSLVPHITGSFDANWVSIELVEDDSGNVFTLRWGSSQGYFIGTYDGINLYNDNLNRYITDTYYYPEALQQRVKIGRKGSVMYIKIGDMVFAEVPLTDNSSTMTFRVRTYIDAGEIELYNITLDGTEVTEGAGTNAIYTLSTGQSLAAKSSVAVLKGCESEYNYAKSDGMTNIPYFIFNETVAPTDDELGRVNRGMQTLFKGFYSKSPIGVGFKGSSGSYYRNTALDGNAITGNYSIIAFIRLPSQPSASISSIFSTQDAGVTQYCFTRITHDATKFTITGFATTSACQIVANHAYDDLVHCMIFANDRTNGKLRGYWDGKLTAEQTGLPEARYLDDYYEPEIFRENENNARILDTGEIFQLLFVKDLYVDTELLAKQIMADPYSALDPTDIAIDLVFGGGSTIKNYGTLGTDFSLTGNDNVIERASLMPPRLKALPVQGNTKYLSISSFSSAQASNTVVSVFALDSDRDFTESPFPDAYEVFWRHAGASKTMLVGKVGDGLFWGSPTYAPENYNWVSPGKLSNNDKSKPMFFAQKIGYDMRGTHNDNRPILHVFGAMEPYAASSSETGDRGVDFTTSGTLYIANDGGLNPYTGMYGFCMYYAIFKGSLKRKDIEYLYNNGMFNNPSQDIINRYPLELFIDFNNPYDDGSLKFPDLSGNDWDVVATGWANLAALQADLVDINSLR